MSVPDAKRLVQTLAWVWLALVLAAFAIYPALTQNVGAHAYDAGAEHVPRGVAFSQAVTDGILLPRWSQFLHWGLGSPLFTFLPPLPYQAMDILSRLGIPHPVGWRLLIAGWISHRFHGRLSARAGVDGQALARAPGRRGLPLRTLRAAQRGRAWLHRSLRHVPLSLGVVGTPMAGPKAFSGTIRDRHLCSGPHVSPAMC